MAPQQDPDALVADVVVIGTGTSGMAAVAAAADLGVEVVAVEATESIGGNSVWSTGYVAFVDSAMQRRAGIRDSEQVFVEDAAKILDALSERFGVIWDEDLTRVYARNSAETYRILTANGVRFSRFIPRPQQHSIDRMAAVEDTAMFRRAFEPGFHRPNVRTLFRTKAERLIAQNGRVAGVSLKTVEDSKTTEVRARAAVILATGGYQANPMLRWRYQPEFMARSPYLGIDTCRGDGHVMGADVGGDLINMTLIPPLVMVSSSFVEDAIAVNRGGQRFHDEAGPYDERVEALHRQPERLGYFIFDDVTAKQKAHLVAQMPEEAISAPRLEALAAEIGCEPRQLPLTVARWNEFLAGAGWKDEFGRVVLPAQRRPIVAPPFHAARMVVGANFTCGGLVVTSSMQVRNVFGELIPGLYAAGDAVGGLNPIADLGGIHLGGGFTLGRIAGQAAARAN